MSKVTRIFSILEYSPKNQRPRIKEAPAFVLTQKTDARTARLIKI